MAEAPPLTGEDGGYAAGLFSDGEDSPLSSMDEDDYEWGPKLLPEPSSANPPVTGLDTKMEDEPFSANPPVTPPRDEEMGEDEPVLKHEPFSKELEMQDTPSPAATVPPRRSYSYNGLALPGLPGHVAGSASNNALSSREQEMRDVPPAPTNEPNTTAAVPQASSFAFGQSHAAPPSFPLGYGRTFETPPFGSFTGFSNLDRPAQGESSRNVPVNYRFVPEVNAPPPPQASDTSPTPSLPRSNPREIAVPRARLPNASSAAPFTSNTGVAAGGQQAPVTQSQQSGRNTNSAQVRRPNTRFAPPPRLLNTTVDKLDFSNFGAPTAGGQQAPVTASR